MYGMSEKEHAEYNRKTVLSLKRIEAELIEHGLTYEVMHDCIICDGESLKPMTIAKLKEFLGY